MKTIELTKGYSTQVDDKEYARCMEGPKWQANERKRKDGSIKNVYAVRTVYNNGKKTAQRMHRFILGVTDTGIKVDHWNHNGLDNWRGNLRVATDAQNNCNARARSDNTSGFKGVCWDNIRQKWRASIQVYGKRKHLGYFSDKREATLAYDAAALLYHGGFAYTNKMMSQEVAA